MNLEINQNNANRSLTGQLMRIDGDLLIVQTDRGMMRVRMYDQTRFQITKTMPALKLVPGMMIRVNGSLEENQVINAIQITILPEPPASETLRNPNESPRR